MKEGLTREQAEVFRLPKNLSQEELVAKFQTFDRLALIHTERLGPGNRASVIFIAAMGRTIRRLEKHEIPTQEMEGLRTRFQEVSELNPGVRREPNTRC